MRNKAINVLLDMGIPAGLRGLQIIADVMELFEKDDVRDGNITALYALLAKRYNTSPTSVERNIRTAFEALRKRGNDNVVSKYLNFNSPTNSNLLHTLYWRLTMEG